MVVEKIVAHSYLCRDCQACMLVCSLYHEGESNPGLSRVQVSKDMANYVFDVTLCQHCDPPDCMLACSVDAIRLNEHDVAVINMEDCIQCGACLVACPYHALFYYQPVDAYLKCDLCYGRPEGPACSQICPVGAIVIG